MGVGARGLQSSSQAGWSSLERITRPPTGLLIWPQKGMYWCLPAWAIGPVAMAFMEAEATRHGVAPKGVRSPASRAEVREQTDGG